MCQKTEWIEKMTFIKSQVEETVKQDAEGVTVRMATITCRCGWNRGIMHMFQCLYCKEYFCMSCAETHFGKTVKQYREENPTPIGID
jgi:predicted nucleic acid binding AN1-type Zn finger protein